MRCKSISSKTYQR